MKAFKFLAAGAVAPFSRVTWPTPTSSEAGPWLSADGALTACARGIHACEVQHLSCWLDTELWLIELDGEVRREPHKLVAARGRLLQRVEAWGPETERVFAEAAALRARDLVAARLRQIGDEAQAVQLESAQSATDLDRVLDGKTGGTSGQAMVLGYLLDALCYRKVDPRASAFCAAHAAGNEADFWQERAWQSRWIANRLGVGQVC